MGTDNGNDVGEVVDDAVAATFDALQLLLGTALGGLAGVVIGLLVTGIGRFWAKRHPSYQHVHNRVKRPVEVLLIVIGMWVGYSISVSKVDPEVAPQWLDYVSHAFLILVIICAAWLAGSFVNGLVESFYHRIKESSEDHALRVKTQVQILHRVIIVAVYIVAFAAVLLTFPGARAAGASLLASAGLISVVAGLAAQSVLGNMFAGLQLAFSDSIRVGDIVFYQQSMATVEEITLTYVVLAVWDGRRIIVPSSKMTTESFENWTRREPQMSGSVDWVVDWAIPISAARSQLHHLLQTTDLWDGDLGVLQVAEADQGLIKLRALVSAKDSSTLSDLKNYLREAMVTWIQAEAPQAVPHLRRYVDSPIDFAEMAEATKARVEERIKDELPAFEPGEVAVEEVDADDSEARTTVISPKELAEFSRTPIADRDVDMTILMDPISEVITTKGHESSLFTGSAKAEKRAEVYSGPGEKVLEERRRKLAEQTGNHELIEEEDDD